MSRKPEKTPTDTELAILRVLWELGPSTVRQVYERMSREGSVGYTTVLKMLQIMTAKSLVDRDETSRAHVYEARESRDRTQGRLVSHLLERAFDGSASKLVLRAFDAQPASPAEIAEIRRMLDEMEGEAS